MEKVRKPTVLVLDRARRVVTRDPAPEPLPAADSVPPPPPPRSAGKATKAKVVERLKRLPRAASRGFHPMD